MSDIEKAAKDAVEAAANSEQLALIAAVLQAQQLTQQQTPAPAPAATPANGNTVKWLVIGGGVAVGAPFFLIAFAIAAMATAITVMGATTCALVLYGVWRDIRKPK